MRSFDQLLGLLSNIPDPRRAEGKLYKLQHVLLFSILAVVTGGNSYRSIVTFIKVHRRRLNAAFGLHWRRAPAHTSIRYILQGLEPQAVEQIFRQHAAGLCSAITDPARRVIAIDGKTLRRSWTRRRTPGAWSDLMIRFGARSVGGRDGVTAWVLRSRRSICGAVESG